MIHKIQAISCFLKQYFLSIHLERSRRFATPKFAAMAVLAAMLSLSLLTGQAQAQFAGGSGTAADPYQIETVEQLQDVGQEEYRGSHFILIADIDASDTKNWNDGKGFEPLMGRFYLDGQGHVISDLTINRSNQNSVGLFGHVGNSVIENIGLKNVDITGNWWVGGLVGDSETVRIVNSWVTGKVSGNREVGGLVGRFRIDCGIDNTGMIVGEGAVLASYTDVHVTGEERVGGLIGIIGHIVHTAKISEAELANKYAMEEDIQNIISLACGVFDTYAVGQVTGNKETGGLFGFGITELMGSSFWDMETTRQNESTGKFESSSKAVGLTTDQMTGQNAFIYMNKLDFEHTWQLTEGYPVLRWQDPEDAVEPPFAGGSGTAEDPWHVATLEQLQLIDEYHEYHFKLISDIDASETAEWNDGKGFKPARLTGSFDGGGHIISNLYINRPDEYHVGLFGFAQRAKIENTGLVDVEINGRESVGGIAGTSYLSDIHKSFVTGSVTGGDRYVGGLVGEFFFFTPSHSYFGEATAWNCYADVTVSGKGHVGGLVGVAYWYRITPIDDDDYAKPTFTGIYESFSVGQVVGQSSTGGFIGSGYPEYIDSNYWDRESSGQNQWEGSDDDSQSGIGLSTDQMTGQSAYIHMYELDFVNNWQLTEGYPVLRWQDPEDAMDPPEVPIIRVDTTKRDFGLVSTDSSGTVDISIRNTGNNMLNGEVHLTGPDAGLFAIADGLSTFSLEAGGSQAVEITFSPEGLENYEAELHIVHDAPNRSDTLNIRLSGQGKEPTDATSDPGPGLPGELALHQNYPNPFNPSTRIRYSLPEPVHVTVAVFDITGRHVATLVDRPMPPGEHATEFEAAGLSSGIYVYRIQAGDFVLTRRMTFVK